MKYIDDMVEKVDEEIEGAMEYAEQYIVQRAAGNMSRAGQYREMAMQELNHATIIRDYAIQDVEAIKKNHTLTEEEDERWNRCLRKLTEKMAGVKTLLA